MVVFLERLEPGEGASERRPWSGDRKRLLGVGLGWSET